MHFLQDCIKPSSVESMIDEHMTISKDQMFTIQASKPEMEFHMKNMMYPALPMPMHAQTEKTTFSCKDDCILTKHTRRWTYSPLRLQCDLCRTSLPKIGVETGYFGP